MAEDKTKKTTKPTSSTKKTEPKATANSEKKDKEESVSKPIKAKEVDVHQFIKVKNGFYGKLVYISKRTGEIYEWSEYGDELLIELLELKAAKSTRAKKLFEKNYFVFEDDWVLDYLGVSQYYKNSISPEEFDSLLEKPADEIRDIVLKMPEGQRHSLSYRAMQLISEGAIDSRKTISMLEEVLKVELVEK